MLWGMPTMVELPDIESNAQVCRRLGLDFVEINMNLPAYQPEYLEKLQTCDDVFYTIHLDENFCPADFNPMIARAWMETMRLTMRAAKRIGAPVINMHMSKGVYFTLPGRKVFLFDRYRDAYLKSMLRLRDLCEEELDGSDVRICIENTGGYLDFQKEAIELLLESERFALTWDLGHWHKGAMDDAPFLLAHCGRIRHFHVHDANAGGDHLAIGEGEIDLEHMLVTAKDCRARCVLETKTVSALEQSVAWLREHGWTQKKTD